MTNWPSSSDFLKLCCVFWDPPGFYGFWGKFDPNATIEERFILYYSLNLIREYHLLVYAPSLSDLEVKKLSTFYSFHEPQQVIDRGAARLQPGASVAVFPEAGATFPVLTG